jgi:adenosylcobinamide-GDP ribazoletransferase
MNRFLQALSLLTRLPAPARWDERTPPGRAMAFFPLVGGLIGGLLATAAWGLNATRLAESAPWLPAVLLLILWTALTGALHLDGWTDFCDAVFVHATPEKRLQIMADPRAGSFGVVGVVLLLLAKAAALQGVLRLAAADWRAAGTLVAAPVLARLAVVWAARLFPLARPDGMAARFRHGLRRQDLLVATASALPLAACAGLAAAVFVPLALLALLALGRLAVRRLGGVTGDVHGALVELTETLLLAAACALGAGWA